MSGPTIFTTPGLDRARGRWEDELATLTPVERRGDWWYKREDAFAPLGYGGINGSKLRQLLWWLTRDPRPEGVLTGASVLSPQVSMSALVARHLDLPCVVMLGATHAESAIRHVNVRIAAEADAAFVYTPVAYNPALQRAVDRLAAEPCHAGWRRVWYGITTPPDADAELVEAFHAIGAAQVANVPAECRTLVMTMGSANSCTSVLYGLALHQPAALERVVLLGIGPVRHAWLRDRLEKIGEVSAVDVLGRYRWQTDRAVDLPRGDGPVLVEHYDLHSAKYATYGDRMPWSQDGVDFHPTYEGKAMRYLAEHPNLHDSLGDSALFWIVGSAPGLTA